MEGPEIVRLPSKVTSVISRDRPLTVTLYHGSVRVLSSTVTARWKSNATVLSIPSPTSAELLYSGDTHEYRRSVAVTLMSIVVTLPTVAQSMWLSVQPAVVRLSVFTGMLTASPA